MPEPICCFLLCRHFATAGIRSCYKPINTDSTMQKLLSLPPNLIDSFHQLEEVNHTDWFCTSDPVGSKLGSGGGTTWLLQACHQAFAPEETFSKWIGNEKRILLHAGGQSRRLPGYAPSGKILTPIPVFSWERGQKLGQNLLSLQLPLYERIMKQAPKGLNTLIASGDVYIRSEKPLQDIPEVDVVCYGLWVNPSLATHHGVFVSDRKKPEVLDFMLQKPSLEELEGLSKTHLFLMDIGIWILSDRAVEVLMKRSLKEGTNDISYYDLYSDYGLALGEHPQTADDEVNKLSVAILPLPGGEFYHFGTSRELISSTLAIQDKVRDQRRIMHRKVKPNPAIFIQNSFTKVELSAENANLWIENSHVGEGWKLGSRQIITGVPENHWNINLPDGVCIDIVPMGDAAFVARPYGLDDVFKGDLSNDSTTYLGNSFTQWMKEREIGLEDIKGRTDDLQAAPVFPVTTSIEELGILIRWMIAEPQLKEGKELWLRAEKLSADEISAQANLERLYAQRSAFRRDNWKGLSANYEKSVFYQLDLQDAANEFVRFNLEVPAVLKEDAAPMVRIHNRMLRARIMKLQGNDDCKGEEQAAFQLLRDGLLEAVAGKKNYPKLNVYSDQIVWGRSPVRIDVAGGWTDTPPYSLYSGGSVVNLAIELNGQPPLQVYVKPCHEFHIVLRSIDMGAVEVIRSYEELQDYKKVGSPFSIPKAALTLAGFAPLFTAESHASLEEHLKAFGSGLEITLLAAIPAGSGLGTSSILASTVLGAINDFCGLAWDRNDICNYTLVLEQLLTTGGGWQDQYGGVFPGVKLLQSESGFEQHPLVRWLPDQLFVQSEYRDCHLLYYTGITRTAKGILAEIVSSMFLNSGVHLSLLAEMKAHAMDMSEAILRGNFETFGNLVGKSWIQNQALDSGTNPPAVAAIIEQIKDYTLGYKLPGAGGGGYLYMVAKDPQAAGCIRRILTEQAPNPRARFVEMTLSDKGLQVSRS
ncbi:bifunctional fucokinase/L-fucose-1-P-guanylyltransferase [Bacteroides thetaiotaomicron]|nr:bifunctional fucokinase/fucose-1-phosphate guanylyltransferase [Bacteroides thetaiotaomicron]MBV4088735.1 bifunctional fucokinase/L-fucose-1-P-guanylyltransferase [Bacteroides thetaiotaomicron]MBV4100572.1 bifunctional fucokinase/L-fucose-1-P-guanylyltransferase [Bacteroides thetaiotaomicron]MBV4136427.1 bifunctional fucokinase/L-fucose-1-P-guanylyltransferase [Bacteroides thetaiotaomicron]